VETYFVTCRDACTHIKSIDAYWRHRGNKPRESYFTTFDRHRGMHPQKITSKYWVLRVRGRNSKKRNHPHSRILVTDQIMSLQSSDYSSPKRKGYCQVQHRIHGIPRPKQATAQSQQSTSASRPAMRSLAAPIPDESWLFSG